MSLFDDEPQRVVRPGADWETRRTHRDPRSGPPQDEVGRPASSSLLLARTAEVVVAVRAVTAFSDGLLWTVVVLFADEQRTEDLGEAMQDFSRSAGRFRFGAAFSDGRSATTGTRDAPPVQVADGPTLLLLHTRVEALGWHGAYWLNPLPPAGSLVVGCRWPDRGIPETLLQLDAQPLLAAAATSSPVWRTP